MSTTPHTDAPLNIIGIPYDMIETCRWILKHTIYDLFYPLILGIFALPFTEVFNEYIFLLVLVEVAIVVGLFFFYWIRSIFTKEHNVGEMNDEKKWRYEILNKIGEENIVYEIGFVGDIMKMKNYTLKFEKGINKFFKGINLIVGNLEGMIKDETTRRLIRQKHQSKIIQNLREITEPTPKWLICISNNHSADYKKEFFDKTRNFIDSHCGFKAFGYEGRQSIRVADRINIVSGTMWNNYKNDYASQFRDINLHYKPEYFNILFPHWHFENECYIRSKIKKRSRKLLLRGEYYNPNKKFPKLLRRTPINTYQGKSAAKWDLIFGHHSHVPQPIVDVENKNNKYLLAYSGGNFTSSKWINKHQHGLILRCQIVKKNKKGSLAIRKIDWSYTKCKRDRKAKIVHVDIDDKLNDKNAYDFRVTKILLNIFLISLVYLIASPIISSVLSISIFKILEIFRNSLFIIGVQFLAVWAISWILYKYK